MSEFGSHRARKRFGQNFLVDQSIINRIVESIAPHAGQHIVEIGPGQAALTRKLIAALGPKGSIDAIEIDRDLVARLVHEFDAGKLRVHQADAMEFDFATLPAPLRVVGNLPYNISTPILFHLLPLATRIQDQHFMLQKEVVERMVGAPGHKDYGRLSVMLQWRYAMESVLDVPPEAFDPPPRVESAVVRMTPRADPVAIDAKLLSELVTVAFSQRRKLLRHTLGRWLEARGIEGIDVQRRAEEVPVAEYLALAQQAQAAQAEQAANNGQ